MNDEIRWPEFNLKLHNEIIETIEANPSCWKQNSWHCGTSHCYGGWAQIKSGKPANDGTVRRDARMALGLTLTEANYAFNGSNSLETIKNLPKYLKEYRDGFDRDGFDRGGFDRGGFNRYGLDPYGFDRDGFNRYGFNRDGLNRHGFNRHGFNRDGFNRDGFDSDGLDVNNNPKN
jgi:hypothetical protein